MAKKQKHPNCPNCTKGLILHREACYAYWAASKHHIEKLYRLYKRENNSFKPIGWYCKKCGFSIIQKNCISGRNCIQKKAGNGKIIVNIIGGL